MISAKLISSLEKEGFALDFPPYSSNEERIIELLKEHNERLLLALPLLFQYEFAYEKIITKIRKEEIQTFNRIILITNTLFQREKIDNMYLMQTIREYKLRIKITKKELEYYYSNFKDFLQNKNKSDDQILTKQIELRSTLPLNQALAEIYSPGKRRIMNKIFNHEPLTNTELKYYYRSIRPLILAILNEQMQKYLRLVESIKKVREMEL